MPIYSVQRGDNLSTIAARYNTTVDQLVKQNQIANANLINVGQELKIPGKGDSFDAAKTNSGQGMPEINPAGQAPAEAESIALGRSLIGRAYGDPAGASAEPVGPDSPYMHCAQFVNAVYPDLPASAPQLAGMATPGMEPGPGDVIASDQPAPWGHVGIMTESGTVLHSIPGVGVHESSLAEFEKYSPISGVIPK
jgi:LysM repeat protein